MAKLVARNRDGEAATDCPQPIRRVGILADVSPRGFEGGLLRVRVCPATFGGRRKSNKSMASLLESIHSPADLKTLTPEQMTGLGQAAGFQFAMWSHLTYRKR
jgi:hypothetical protein